VGGVVADRLDRRHVLMGSQVIQMSTALTLTALVYTGHIRIWHVLTLSIITGVAQAFGGPAHHSLMPSLVDKEHLPNAIAFNAIQFNLARVIGPLLAGAALTAFGMVACFGLNGLSFLAVIVALLMLRARPPLTAHRAEPEGRDEGRLRLRALESVDGRTGARWGSWARSCGSPLLTFLPLFAKDVLGGDVAQYTHLMSWAGAGAVGRSAGRGVARQVSAHGPRGARLQVALGTVIVLFANTRLPLANALLLFAGGACMVMVFATLQSLVQLRAPNELRGRGDEHLHDGVSRRHAARQPGGGWLANQFTAPPVLTMNGAALALIAAGSHQGHGVKEL
jgi:predicted MFS family arabinose efflux permease